MLTPALLFELLDPAETFDVPEHCPEFVDDEMTIPCAASCTVSAAAHDLVVFVDTRAGINPQLFRALCRKPGAVHRFSACVDNGSTPITVNPVAAIIFDSHDKHFKVVFPIEGHPNEFGAHDNGMISRILSSSIRADAVRLLVCSIDVPATAAAACDDDDADSDDAGYQDVLQQQRPSQPQQQPATAIGRRRDAQPRG